MVCSLEEVQGGCTFWPDGERDSGKDGSKQMISASAAMLCLGSDPERLVAARESSSTRDLEL